MTTPPTSSPCTHTDKCVFLESTVLYSREHLLHVLWTKAATLPGADALQMFNSSLTTNYCSLWPQGSGKSTMSTWRETRADHIKSSSSISTAHDNHKCSLLQRVTTSSFSVPSSRILQEKLNRPSCTFQVGSLLLVPINCYKLLKYPHYFCILMLAFVWKEKLLLRQETFHAAQPFSPLTDVAVSLLRLQLINPQSCWWCITSPSLSLETKHAWPAPMSTWPLTYCTTRENSQDASLIMLQWRRSSYWSQHPTKQKTERWVWFAYTIVHLCWTTQFDCCLTLEIPFVSSPFHSLLMVSKSTKIICGEVIFGSATSLIFCCFPSCSSRFIVLQLAVIFLGFFLILFIVSIVATMAISLKWKQHFLFKRLTADSCHGIIQQHEPILLQVKWSE